MTEPQDHPAEVGVAPVSPVTPVPAQGRSRSSRPARPVVGVTGACHGVGLALARRLVTDARFARPVALDTQRADAGSLDGATWRLGDVSDPSLATRLSRVGVLVHVAAGDGSTPEQVVRTAATVVTAAAAARVTRVVLVTSAMVYGASPENAVPLHEDAPVAAVPDGGLVGALLEVEALAERATRVHPGLEVVVVRPAALVGEGVDSVYARHVEAPRLLVVRGSRPRWQLCHVDDLVTALLAAALGEVQGAVTVGCEGWLDQDQIETLTGMRRLELPAAVAFGTAERLHRVGVLAAPAGDLAYVVHPWVVDSAQLRARGWRPAYDNATALGVLLEQVDRHATGARRLGRRDATLGAAGAAVAVVGTAALVRAARRRRRV